MDSYHQILGTIQFSSSLSPATYVECQVSVQWLDACGCYACVFGGTRCEPRIGEARVHRIGQTKETFVYRYIIKETIEGRVYSLFNRNTRKNAEVETKKEDKGLGGGEKVVGGRYAQVHLASYTV
ncbi:hypothetical protein BDR26DRAFT_226208 [Obelidium mucronatum]|nr:hypothetical protein BDR26DRAFT_226208 [Obelidium mucronatum]